MTEKYRKGRRLPARVLVGAALAVLVMISAACLFAAPPPGDPDIAQRSRQSFSEEYRDHYQAIWFLVCVLLVQSTAITLLVKSARRRRQADQLLQESEKRLRILAEQSQTHQHELEAINRTLEQRIAEEVQKSREKDQLMMQQSRFAAMGEMIGNIAHQWRQPLNMLGIVIQQMQMEQEKGALTTEIMELRVAKGMELLLYLSRTIDDFRNFFRPGIGPRPFSLAKAVGKTVDFFEPSCSHHGIKVTVEGKSTLRYTGHVNEFSQALLNILNNARDALLEGEFESPGIVVTLSDEGCHGTVTVRDNAGGIKPEVIDKIFDPYFTTKEEGKGTGVGLYMTKTIIERHMQGSITVRNLPDGAEFKVKL